VRASTQQQIAKFLTADQLRQLETLQQQKAEERRQKQSERRSSVLSRSTTPAKPQPFTEARLSTPLSTQSRFFVSAFEAVLLHRGRDTGLAENRCTGDKLPPDCLIKSNKVFHRATKNKNLDELAHQRSVSVKMPFAHTGGNMRRIVLLFTVLALCVGTATAKRDRGSYISQYLTLTEQINTAMEKLQNDVLTAHGETKTKRDKSRQRRMKKERFGLGKANPETSGEEKIDPAELGESKPREARPKQELSPAELAALRQQLLEELPQRVRPIRRRTGRLREIGPVPAELKRANLHVQQYSRHIDAAIDALKQAAYSGNADMKATNAHIAAAKADAAEAERLMGQYLDAKPVKAPSAQS
jgi:hypothetical protein